MTTTEWITAPLNTSAAAFRSWGLGVSDALTALGFPKTADTGQVDWATVAAPSGTYPGYEIRYFDDSLHATAPIYFKIEYGSSSSTARCSLRFTFGPSTNGTGTITNNFAGTTTFAFDLTTATTATTYTNYASCFDLSGFILRGWGQAQPGMFWLERSRDLNGDPTSQGLVFGWKNGSSSANNEVNQRIIERSTGLSWLVRGANVFFPKSMRSASESLFDGSDYYLSPMIHLGSNGLWTSRLILGISLIDFSPAAEFTATLMGVSDTWLATGLSGFGSRFVTNDVTEDSYASAAMYWEA